MRADRSKAAALHRPSALRSADPPSPWKFPMDSGTEDADLLGSAKLQEVVRELRRQGLMSMARHILACHVQGRPDDGRVWAEVVPFAPPSSCLFQIPLSLSPL